ncbi:2Fe-2S iron-sulfur cluster-binding protein [Micromonospora saelicesensis]|nr:2Fe-2S iron-sulfur cluster-binding protein [Micromonospora saelicesensis]
MQLLFGVFAATAGAMIALRPDPPHPFFTTTGAYGYALAAVLSIGGWLALGRPALTARTRQVLIIFHLLFVPAQFLFLLAHAMPWLGMALSSAIVVGLKPRFPRLARMPRKVWLTLHIGIGVGWLGISTGMLLLAIVGATADSHELQHGAYLLLSKFEILLAIPSAFLTIITGVVISLGTPWGLLKHKWVLAKLVIALALPFLAVFEGPWIEELEARSAVGQIETGPTGMLLIGAMGLFAALLWTATILSVLKPGGRTRWGRRKDEGQPTPDTAATVVAARPVAAGTVALQLAPTSGGPLPAWEPGAHIDLVLPSGRVRQYSLCGDPADRYRYQIAVLREPNGRGGSIEAHQLTPGTKLGIRGPRNHFALAEAPSYLFVAGGIGIAPFLPMIEQLAARGANWRLVYRGRSLPAMAFAEHLVRAHPQRVTISPADQQQRPHLEALLKGAPAGTAVYCCGPEAMLDAVGALMPTACPQGVLHLERFVPSAGRREAVRAPFEAELRRSGRVVQIPADRSLLSAMQDIDPTVDASCTDGVCGSCETRVLDGVPDHRDDVLQPGERNRRDVIYPCVSRSLGPRIVLDA